MSGRNVFLSRITSNRGAGEGRLFTLIFMVCLVILLVLQLKYCSPTPPKPAPPPPPAAEAPAPPPQPAAPAPAPVAQAPAAPAAPPPAAKAPEVLPLSNVVVVFDKSDSMNPQYDPAGMSRLDFAKKTVSGLIQAVPPDRTLNASLRLFGAEKRASDESTWLVYKMAPLNKAEFQKAVTAMGRQGLGRSPIGRALAGAGADLKGLSNRSAIFLVSDFESAKNVDDIRPKSVMENIAKLKGSYGDKLCIYPIQIGKNPEAKKLAEEIAKNAKCGFVENADNLQTPEAMAAYVKKIF